MEADAHQGASGKAAWQTTSIAFERTRRRIYTTSGFLDDAAADQAAGVVSSTFVQDGRILSPRADEFRPGVSPPNRATLREGDLAVVLVRRVGDSALVTAEHAGCTATRSIGIIRAEPHMVRWLRIWLQTPTAKARIDEDVTAHVEPTISLDTLHRMLFPLPPPDVINTYHRAFGLIEEMTALYQETARKAVELADALHEDYASTIPPGETQRLEKVAKPKTGTGSERSLPPLPTETTTEVADVVAPKDLYDLPVPHVHSFRLRSRAEDGEAHPPGTLMLSTRSDGAHIAVSRRPATALRSVVAVRPVEDEDGWWLLHELRSKSRDIAGLAQGQNSREISAHALKRLEITWPDRFTRTDFHAMAEPLHAVARHMVAKIATLHTLRDTLLRDISAKAGVLREPTTEPQERGAPPPRPTTGPARAFQYGRD
ncbi:MULTISPECIES: restriction endonuclease subunit S domain-containing protein [Streptomyces]|uniref:Type I restriction modification DNA specificity domain-containing protein n=1 Tax=Streptomyces galilaeus TaxID=33899 RepID=A0ABW9IAV2_STRGJ